MQNNIPVYSYSNSPHSYCCMNTDYQRSQNFSIFVKYEQHSTKIYYLNSDSMVINWSTTSCYSPFSAILVTCDILSFKTGHLISTMKRCWTRYIRRNSLLQNFEGNFQCPQKPSTNYSHKSNTSNTKLPFHSINTHFFIIFKSVWGSIISKITRIYAGRSGVQILTGATELSFLQNIHTSSSALPAFKSSFFSGSKVARMDSLITHPSRAKFKNQWNYNTTEPVSPHSTQSVNFILPSPPTYVHICQEVTSFQVL